jgi:hypothetical protein
MLSLYQTITSEKSDSVLVKQSTSSQDGSEANVYRAGYSCFSLWNVTCSFLLLQQQSSTQLLSVQSLRFSPEP